MGDRRPRLCWAAARVTVGHSQPRFRVGPRLQPTAPLHPSHSRDTTANGLTSAAWWALRGAGPRDALGCSCGSFKVLGGHGELRLPGLGARRSGAAETSPAGSTVTALASAARRARWSGWVQPRSPPSAGPSLPSQHRGREEAGAEGSHSTPVSSPVHCWQGLSPLVSRRGRGPGLQVRGCGVIYRSRRAQKDSRHLCAVHRSRAEVCQWEDTALSRWPPALPRWCWTKPRSPSSRVGSGPVLHRMNLGSEPGPGDGQAP